MSSKHGHEHDPLSELSLDDGGLIIFDPGNHRAWVQADAPVRPRA